jgi:hypothetical protein
MDYLRGFMGVHAVDSSWTLDPRLEIGTKYDTEGVPRGIGNQVSVEFNLLYRFHSPISKQDESWTETFFKMFTKENTIEDIYKMPQDELWVKVADHLKEIDEDPGKRDFYGLDKNDEGELVKLKRKKEKDDSSFEDKDLMKIISKSIEDPIGKSSPEFLSLPYRHPNLFYSKAPLELGTFQRFSALWKSSEFYRPVNGTHPNSNLMISG